MAEHVFVYGSLKRGFHNFRLLEAAEFVGAAMTMEAEFRMGNVGTFPEITRDNSEQAGFVLGEIFLCNVSTIVVLDQLEGNGESYQREPVHFRLIDAPDINSITAWTYLWLRPPCPNLKAARFEGSNPVYEWRECP